MIKFSPNSGCMITFLCYNVILVQKQILALGFCKQNKIRLTGARHVYILFMPCNKYTFGVYVHALNTHSLGIQNTTVNI